MMELNAIASLEPTLKPPNAFRTTNADAVPLRGGTEKGQSRQAKLMEAPKDQS